MITRGIQKGLWVIAPVGIVVFFAQSPQLSAIAIALGVGVVAMKVFPPRILIFIWGALLPIWSIGPVDPLYFDVARLALAVMIVAQSRRVIRSLWTENSWRVAIPLGLVGIALCLLGITRPEASSVSLGGTMLLSLTAGWMVLSRTASPWSLLNGYLVGVACSAAVLILSSVGFTALAPQSDAGYFRLTGLSPSATLVTYQMAIGVVLSWAAISRGIKPLWYVGSLATFLVALVLSGGRGGVVAFGLALLVSLRWHWFRLLPAILIGLVAWFVITEAESSGITLNTLQRFASSSESGQADGRIGLFSDALKSVGANVITGEGLSGFTSEFGSAPHFAPLTFFVAGGVFCGALILSVCVQVLHRIAFRSPTSFGADGRAAYLMLAVLICTAIFEPTGPFVGAEYVALLLLSVGLTSRSLIRESHESLPYARGKRNLRSPLVRGAIGSTSLRVENSDRYMVPTMYLR